jgi:hypothetical protein
MTNGDWHWLTVGWCVLGGLVLVAWMGHKVRWTKDTLLRERFPHWLAIVVAGAAVGWIYSYVAPPIFMFGVGVLVYPLAGWIFGLFVLCFVVCLPFSALAWLHITLYEWRLRPKILQRWEDQRAAARRRRRAKLGLPQDD